MNMQKQIEEMARAMCFQRESCTAESCIEVNCEKTWLAENLYNAGYRKASEIFEDIETYMFYHENIPNTIYKSIDFSLFNKLKKKYTEREKDNG